MVSAQAQVRVVKRLDAFHSIDNKTDFDIGLIDRGVSGTVTIEGHKNAVGLVTASSKEGILFLSMEKPRNWLPRLPFFNARLEVRHSPQVSVASRGLTSIRTSGTGTITVEGLRFRDLKIENSGDGNLRFIRCRFYSLEVLLKGNGTISFDRGDSLDTRLQVEGDGSILAHSLRTKNLAARVFGKGRITGYPRELLNAKVTGKGAVLYRGNPVSVEKETAEGGRVDKYLEIDSSEVEPASGSGDRR